MNQEKSETETPKMAKSWLNKALPRNDSAYVWTKLILMLFYILTLIATITFTCIGDYRYYRNSGVIFIGLIYHLIYSVVGMIAVCKENQVMLVVWTVMGVVTSISFGLIYYWATFILVIFTTMLTGINAIMIYQELNLIDPKSNTLTALEQKMNKLMKNGFKINYGVVFRAVIMIISLLFAIAAFVLIITYQSYSSVSLYCPYKQSNRYSSSSTYYDYNFKTRNEILTRFPFEFSPTTNWQQNPSCNSSVELTDKSYPGFDYSPNAYLYAGAGLMSTSYSVIWILFYTFGHRFYKRGTLVKLFDILVTLCVITFWVGTTYLWVFRIGFLIVKTSPRYIWKFMPACGEEYGVQNRDGIHGYCDKTGPYGLSLLYVSIIMGCFSVAFLVVHLIMVIRDLFKRQKHDHLPIVSHMDE